MEQRLEKWIDEMKDNLDEVQHNVEVIESSRTLSADMMDEFHQFKRHIEVSFILWNRLRYGP